jgi:hypothetical protein
MDPLDVSQVVDDRVVLDRGRDWQDIVSAPRSNSNTGESEHVRHLVLLVVSASFIVAFGCGGASSPTSPSLPVASPSPPVSSQPIHDTLNGAGSDQNVTGAYDGQVLDDFVSSAAVSIQMVSWQGVRDPERQPTRFYVLFVPDNGGFPLRLVDEGNTGRPRALYSVMYAFDQVNEHLDFTRPCESAPLRPCGFYDYSVTLPMSFAAAAGTRYWLEIVAESAGTARSGWGWRKGKPDNGLAVPDIAGGLFTWDMAFALR